MNIEPTWELDSEEYPGRAWPGWPGTFHVNGCGVHLFAIRVQADEHGRLSAWQEDWSAELEAAEALAGRDCGLQAHPLPGLEGLWIIVAHPYGA